MQKAKEAEDAEAAAKKKAGDSELEGKLANARKIKADRDAKEAAGKDGAKKEQGDKKPVVDSADLSAQLKLARQ